MQAYSFKLPFNWGGTTIRLAAAGSVEAQTRLKPVQHIDRLPTSKQVTFAEKLARIKQRAVPDECFRNKGLMSQWIDGNR